MAMTRRLLPLHRPSSTTSRIPSLFLQLPPTYRSFHASPQPQFLNTAIGATHTVLDTLHSTTGLPWAYTLPLFALFVRTTLVLPIAIYQRHALQRRLQLQPLISAWRHVLRKETIAEVGHLGPAVSQRKASSKVGQKSTEIYKRYGCGAWKDFLPAIQLPIWLVAIETIRKMCGTREGLLGMVASQFSSSDTPAGPIDVHAALPLPREETFATEGALWFPDLLLPDPQLILPFMLSGAMLLNLHKVVGPNANKFQRRLGRSLQLVALAIGPLTLHIPSAMLVYWVSSSLLAWTQARLLDKFMPIKPPVLPCQPKKSRIALGSEKEQTIV